MTQLANFRRRSSRDRLLFLEALACTTWAKLVVHTMPFRWLAPRLGQPHRETPAILPVAQRAIAVDVSWAVQAVARHVPFRFVCLPQAIAAKWMLRRRQVATTLYLGVSPDPEKKAAMVAHAWLRAGDKIVTGEAEAARHTVVATFSADNE